MKKHLLIVFTLMYFNVHTQSELNLYSMQYIPQAAFVNPSTFPTTKFHLGFSSNMRFSAPFSYNDIVAKNENSVITIDADRFYGNVKANNIISAQIVPDISLGFGIGHRGYATLSLRENFTTGMSIPGDLFDFVINGNGASIGQKQNIGGFKVEGVHYREYAGGLAYKFNPKWDFGLKLKYLQGFQNIKTVKSDISLTTLDDNYTLVLTGDYQINVSGTDSASLEEHANNPFSSLGNTGFGADFGATYHFNDKLKFSASLVDLGFISWKNNNRVIKNKPNTTYTFSGLDAYELYSDGESSYIDNILDSIKDRFEIEDKESNESYSTSLNTKLFLNASYRLTKRVTLGGTGALYSGYGTVLPAMSIFTRFDVFKILQAQINYSASQNSIANIGVGMALNLAALQIHYTSDNLLASALFPKDAKNISFRLGVNFLWAYGKKDKYYVNPYPQLEPKSIPPAPTNELDEKFGDVDTTSSPDLVEDTLISEVKNIAQVNDLCPGIDGDSSNMGCPQDIDMSRLKDGSLLIYLKGATSLNEDYKRKFDAHLVQLRENPSKNLFLIIHNTKEEAMDKNTIGFDRQMKLKKYIQKTNTSENPITVDRVKVVNRGITQPISSEKYTEFFNRSVEVMVK